MRECREKVVFNLIIESNEEEGTYGPNFDSAGGFNLKTPVLIVICNDGPSCMADDEYSCKARADKPPKKNVEAECYLP